MSWDDDPTIAKGFDGVSPMRQGTVELAYERVGSSAASLAAPWRAIDLCTRNTTYTLDARLRCTAVLDRGTGKPQKEHLFVGAELVGGAERTDKGRLLAAAHPLPEVGMHAVFRGERNRRPWWNETSKVVRVIIRQRVVEFSLDAPPPAWDRITGRDTQPGY